MGCFWWLVWQHDIECVMWAAMPAKFGQCRLPCPVQGHAVPCTQLTALGLSCLQLLRHQRRGPVRGPGLVRACG